MKTKELVMKLLNSDTPQKMSGKVSVALIGLGAHSKRTHLHYFKNNKIDLALVVELESNKDSAKNYLYEQGFKNTKVFTINDDLKDRAVLPESISDNLLAVCKTMDITHIVIATEPKAHNMYLTFALTNNIHVLTDKPITVSKKMISLNSIKNLRKQYYNIYELAKNSNAMCYVLCQRQYDKGYQYIKDLLSDIVTKYQVPITYVDIYHCDGAWEMAHDLEKENHPYKYGYGKLFHSGYHLIDLLSDFIKINNKLGGTKKITKGEVYSNCFTPNDEINVFNTDDYKRIFKDQKIPEYYFNNSDPKFKNYGEKNFYGLFKFTNTYNQTITNVNMNLLHYGVSRRGWIETKDFYKSNGRIRHERITIQVGTLLSIQIHSYQSKEIGDRTKASEEEVGGLEHFDIDVYRNVDIIGGKPFERITLGSLYSEEEKKDMSSFSEVSRVAYLDKFFKGKCDKGDIKEQALGIEMLFSCALGIRNSYKNREHTEKIIVRNDYTFPIKINDLKKYSMRDNISEEKDDNTKIYHINNGNREIGVVLNNLINKKTHGTYLYISEGNNIASMLLYKEFRLKTFALIYFYYLKKIAKNENLAKVAKLLGL